MHTYKTLNLKSECVFSENPSVTLPNFKHLLTLTFGKSSVSFVYLSARAEILIAQGTQDGPCCNSTSVISLYLMTVRSALASSYEEVRMNFNCTHWNVTTLL